ncbi:MAG: PAS domain S-box protein [Holophagaceae bacterium]|nr:PAS domain S-box protein [Holophagaceae bacterium]
MPEPTGHPAHWSSLFEALPQGVLLVDREGSYLEANAAALKLLGTDRPTLRARRLGEDSWNLLSADGSVMSVAETPGARTLRTGKPVHRQVVGVVEDDGDVLWLDISAEPTQGGGALISFDDITRHHLTETILAARARIAELASSATLEQVLRATLDEAERLTGSCIGFFHFMEPDQKSLTLQAWSTRTESEFCHAEGRGLHYEVDKAGVWVDAVHARKPVIHNDYASLSHKKGMPAGHATVLRELVVPVLREERIVALVGVGNKPFPYGNRDLQTVERLADLAWDIAERKRSEVALTQSEADYRTLFESMAHGAFRQRADGSLIDVNEAALQLFGLSRNEFLGRTSMTPSWDVVREDGLPFPGEDHPSMKALRTGKPVLGEVLGVANPRTGFRVWLEVSAVPEFHPGERAPYRVMVTLHDLTERRRLEASLQESETRWHTIVEQAGDGFELLDEEGRYLQVNEASCRALGYSREELLGMSIFQVDPTLDPGKFHKSFSLQAGQPPRTYETMHRRKDGTEFPVEATVTVTRIGAHLRALAQVRDTTERKRAEATLAASEARARAMLQTAMDGVWLIDGEGRFKEINEAACRMVGYSAEELRSLRVADLEVQENPEEVLRHLARIRERGWDQFESRLRRKDGTDFPVDLSVTYLPGLDQLVAYFRDITARRQAEMDLREREAQYRGLFESMQEGFALHEILTDGQGRPVDYRFLDVNPAFVEMTGIPRERWLGRRVLEILPGTEPRWIREYGEVALTGRPITFEEESKDLGRWYRVTAYRPALRQFAVLVTDVTSQKQAEEARARLELQVARTQRMESLGSLAGGVAHDMNNVLGAIMGLASIHQDQEPEGSRLHKSMTTILKACTRGRTMVKGLLGFARQGLDEVRILDLNEVVREDLALLERTIPASIRVEPDLAEDLHRMEGDPAALSHILMNLCVNAMDAMPAGGILRVRTRNAGPDQLEMEVSDTGIGMPPEVLEKALDPFFTTKAQGKGTGLGLAIVYGTVKAHHGRLDLLSTVGEGTRVILHFPVAAETSEHLADIRVPAGRVRSLNILVVDDDELMQESLSALLHTLGHQPLLAGSGEEALRCLEEGLRVDLVLLDLNMPGLGGAGTLPLLQAAHPDLPILLSTGRADQTAMDLVAAHPGTALLAKPFSAEEVQGHLHQLGLG